MAADRTSWGRRAAAADTVDTAVPSVLRVQVLTYLNGVES